MSIAVSENMQAISQSVSLPSDIGRQASPDFLAIRKVASRKRKAPNNNTNNSSYSSIYDPSASPPSAFSSETESCADRLHFAQAAEQLVAAASLVASLSSHSDSPNDSHHENSNLDTRSVSPSTSLPSSPPDSGNRGPYSTQGSMKGLTDEERRQRRLIRNREAAKECRKKKKLYVSELEEKVQKLEDDNDRLHREVQELQAKLTLSTMHTSAEVAHRV
ncbi:hypothetical protein K7432_003706 [Basidiobolus ranarum]|uniref:BZIP domain-containing protein n=1 Tax=Basidiobolus ranarum TaxID=34480 RepID=A0ABR2WZE6_9FUNG